MQQNDRLRKLEEAVLEAARNAVRNGQVSSSTLAPGEHGIGGQMMTGWFPADRIRDLAEATEDLMAEEARVDAT